MLPLRIAIDARSLRGERTGVGRYTGCLLEALVEVDPDLELLLVADGPLDGAVSGARVKTAFRAGPAGNFLWSNGALRRELARHPLDLFHSPSYTLPLGLRVPAVVSLHDISYAARPEWYPYRSGALRRAWYRSSARRAAHVLTMSDFSRREIERVYGIAPERVTTVYLGVDGARFHPLSDPAPLEALRARHRLPRDFLLFVGDIHPRRNVERLAEATASLRETGFPDLGLVLVGRRLAGGTVPEHPAVRHLGYVPEADLPLLYSAARAFVFPSFYEGFGLGVVEAMACGCPVVVARGTACEEVAGAAGLAVDPADARALAEAAGALLADRALAAERGRAGRARAAGFTWRQTAEATLAVYRRAARK